MNILFMGTPEIAATCLASLLDGGYRVVAAVSQPDRPKGRGLTLLPTPVKALAMERGIPVYQPESVKDEALLPLLTETKPDAIVVVAYGKILPSYILRFPRYGCVNLHVSLLPKYRGAAPMQRAVMNGETETGVTAMLMDEGLDTGDILFAETFPIGEEDTFETVHDTSARIGGPLLCKTLAALAAGTVTPRKQEGVATYAEKITKEDQKIDFTLPAGVLHARIRGLSPIPLALTKTPDGKLLKIVSARVTEGKGRPGEVLRLEKEGFAVACGEGALLVTRIVPEGKGRMDAADFVRGRKIAVGDVLGEDTP